MERDVRNKKFLLFVAATLVASAVHADRYLVMASSSKRLPTRFERQIKQAGGKVVERLPQIGVAIVESNRGDFDLRAQGIKGVRSVVHDVTFRTEQPPAVPVSSAMINPPDSGDDDFYFDLQWDLDAIDAPEAWQLGHRGAGVRVAVLDSGIDPDHPDLAPNLNTALSTSFIDGETFDSPAGSHGTHVAGTIGAADNGLGIIGVAPEAELVAVKVLSGVNGDGTYASVIQGIVYAAEIDADVINMSLGVRGGLPRNCTFGDDHTPAWECAELFVATSRATSHAHRRGATIVSSAGNDHRDLDRDGPIKHYAGELPHVIAVAATAPNGWAVDPGTFLDWPADYSNYGKSAIHFAAPGGERWYSGGGTCVVAGVSSSCRSFDQVVSATPNGNWSWMRGTSMAAPHVSGVAALIIGANGGDMHPAQVERQLRRGADDLGKRGHDDFYGAGRVNAYGSVR